MKTTNTIKNFAKRVVMALVAVLTVSNAWGDLYSFTFANGDLTTSSTSFTKGGVTWSLSATENQWNGTANKTGYVFGSGSNPKPLTVSTSGISGTITEVSVTGRSNNSNKYATVSVTVGGTDFSTSDDTWDNGNNQTLTFTGSASGEISVHIEPTNCGHILSGISVTYSSGPTTYAITYAVSPTGTGTISGGSSPLAQGATATLTASPNSGYKFSSWSVSGGGSTLSSTSTNPTTLTVGNAATTVTANFATVTYENYRTLCTPASDPSITVSPASITNLDYIVGQGPSAAQTFNVKGANLTGNLTVKANDDYEICLTNSATAADWKSGNTTLTITQANAESLSGQTVYVRLKSGKSVGDYNSRTIKVYGGGVAEGSASTVTVSGSVLQPTITADPSSVSWNTQIGVTAETRSVTVTGVNLSANISAELTGGDASSFSISTASITQTAGSASGSITITYTGSIAATTTKSTTLHLTSTNAEPVDVSISFSVIEDPREKFTLLTSSNISDLSDGAKLVLVERTRGYVMNTTSGTNGHEQVNTGFEFLESNTIIALEETNEVEVLTLVASDDGTYLLKTLGNQYIYYSSGNTHKTGALPSPVTSGYQWTISMFPEDNYVNIKSTNCLGYNGGASGQKFRSYSESTITGAYNTYAIYAYYQPSSDPSISLTASLSKFEYVYGSGPSSPAQTFTVSGKNLSNDLVVSVPSNIYQVSKNGSSDWGSSVSYTPSTGTVSSQTVYIRLKAGLSANAYDYAAASGLRVTSTGATERNAALEGEVKYSVSISANNGSYGSVSPTSGTTRTSIDVTATPNANYRVPTTGGYTVTSGTATVVNNGDGTFTITPTSNCAVTINFEAIPTHKVAYWATGTKIQETDVQEGAAIPDQTTETASEIEAYCGNRDHFVGWTTNSSYSHSTDAPAGMITSMSPGGTMSTSDVNYYAVFANTGGVGSTSFSRVTSLSQLADGDVIAIVAEQSGGQIFSTSADHKGGAAPSETEGKITVSASTNQWTLEASSSDWKLHKGDNYADILCADLTYTAYGNAMSIVDAVSANYFYIKKNSNSYLEYWSNTWQFYTNNSPNNGNIRLKIYKQDAGYVDYTTQCCSLQPVTDVVVNSMTNTSVTLGWTLPASTTGITKFQVIDVDNGNAVVKDNISTSATNSGSISGLTKCNTYHYKVVSYSSTCTVTSSAIEFRPFGDARTVNFNYNGGTGTPASFTTSCDGTSTTLPTPDSRDGYTFLGWWSAENGGDKRGDAGDSYTVTGNTTIWAHWAQNFTVHYDRHNGTAVCSDETCGAGLTYTVCTTEPTRSGYIFAGWKDAATSTVYNAGDNFTMPSANVTLDAQWTDNWRNLTFNVPAGGGSASGVPSGNHVRDGQSFTMPTITGKADSKWCWTFLGWTETAPNGSGRWDVTPSYIAGGATSGAITSDKTYYAVYSKTGAGSSGTAELTCTDMYNWITTTLSGTANNYGTTTSHTAADGFTWQTNGQVTTVSQGAHLVIRDRTNSNGVSWIKLPTFGGNIREIRLEVSQGNSNTSCSNLGNDTGNGIGLQTGSSNSETVIASSEHTSSKSRTITVIGSHTTGYLTIDYAASSSGATNIISIEVDYGPPAVYGYTLDDCPCIVTQFDLIYNANTANFPGSTISCVNVDDYKWSENDDEYTFCDAPTLAGYRFLYWAESANGSGNHWNAGETVTCLPSDNLTVYAFYEQVHTVTFDNQGTLTPVTQSGAGQPIAVPAATTPCDGEWAFVGWSETAIAPMSMLPSIEIASGTSTYTPTADKTLYAIYRKTSTSSAFVAGMSGAYKISNGNTVYAGACNNNRLPETNAAGAAVFYIKYTSADGGKYTIQQSDGKYLKYAGSSTSLALDDETPYYWTMTKNGDLWHVLGVGSGRYLQYNSGTGFKAYNTSGYTDIAFVAADGQYYYRTMSCASDYDITFHANGTTINWAVGHPEAEYKDLANATVVSTFPTATFAGWTFLGWRRSDYAESTTAPASSGIFGGSDGTSGNALTISSANEDLYPVFTKFEDNEPFDQVNGGDYYIYFLQEGSDDGYGGEKRVYAGEYEGGKRYYSTALCANAREFTFTKLANGNWTIKDKTTGNYLYGIDGDDDLKQRASATNSEWTLTVNGNQFDAFHVGTTYGQLIANGDGTSATFMNYRRTNISQTPSLYHRVYLGGCSNRVFTTNPSNTPEIEIHGQVKVTSTATKSVKARSVLTVTASNISTANLTVTSDNSAFKFSLTQNGSYTASVNIPVVSNKVGVTPIYIEYTPAAGSTSDGIEGAIVTVSDGAGTPTSVSTLSGDVQGRHLPANFVIAAKWDDKWYALPANCTTSTSSTTGILIEVDNASDPTTATLAPDYTKYGLREVASGRYAANGSNVTFVEKLTTSPAKEYTLYNGSTTSIQVNAQWSGYSASNPDKYEWVPSTDDFKDYTLTSADGSNIRPLCMNTSGVFGTYTSAQSYGGKVRLLPATFYEEGPVQIVEWKANSVVVMYTGSETSATTRVGSNSASSAQTLSTHKLTHGVYELTTDQSLASNDGKTLLLGFGDTKKAFDIPVIITGNVTATDGHAKQDAVIVSGGKLTAAATKYSYRNIYVYGGGKLKIASGTSLGVNNIILRAGGIATSGIGSSPSATYEYIYPQVELGGTLTSTKTNIQYEYITDYEHWYHLCLPFNATLNSIHYPTEYYGTNVTENNTGSWIIKRYDGAIRSTGEYNAWKDIEKDDPKPTTTTAGIGYIFWGAPKKVSVGGADAVRQAWGIQRMTMSVTADAATTAETNNKNISVDSYSEVATSTKPNDQGWNLVGNPYMVNLANWSSESMIQGQLVHTETDPWDGKWRNDGTAVRYVTIPDNHFGDYKAKTTATAIGLGDLMPGRAFFVQIAEGASTLTFATSNRASLMPALYATTESVDIETGIVMSDESKQDEVNFWIKDGKTAEYEYNADYPKTPNNSHFNIYGVHSHGDLSWIAISPEIAEGSMAIGYQVPKGGEYMLSMSETYVSDKIEHMFVTDHAMNPEVTVDLMDGSYEFTVNQAETNDVRFTASIKLKDEQQTPTGIEQMDNGQWTMDNCRKILFNDHIYIIRGGVLYDATGKKVGEINK